MNFHEAFGRLRSICHSTSLDHETMYALLWRLHDEDPDRYQEQILGYLAQVDLGLVTHALVLDEVQDKLLRLRTLYPQGTRFGLSLRQPIEFWEDYSFLYESGLHIEALSANIPYNYTQLDLLRLLDGIETMPNLKHLPSMPAHRSVIQFLENTSQQFDSIRLWHGPQSINQRHVNVFKARLRPGGKLSLSKVSVTKAFLNKVFHHIEDIELFGIRCPQVDIFDLKWSNKPLAIKHLHLWFCDDVEMAISYQLSQCIVPLESFRLDACMEDGACVWSFMEGNAPELHTLELAGLQYEQQPFFEALGHANMPKLKVLRVYETHRAIDVSYGFMGYVDDSAKLAIWRAPLFDQLEVFEVHRAYSLPFWAQSFV